MNLTRLTVSELASLIVGIRVFLVSNLDVLFFLRGVADWLTGLFINLNFFLFFFFLLGLVILIFFLLLLLLFLGLLLGLLGGFLVLLFNLLILLFISFFSLGQWLLLASLAGLGKLFLLLSGFLKGLSLSSGI